MRSSWLWLLLVVSFLLFGAVAVRPTVHLREQEPAGPDAEIVRVRELAPLRVPSIIRGRDVGFSARSSDQTWDYCGMAHPELTRDNGRVEYITYCRDTGFLE
jgi:hypothetical protein